MEIPRIPAGQCLESMVNWTLYVRVLLYPHTELKKKTGLQHKDAQKWIDYVAWLRKTEELKKLLMERADGATVPT